jgi:predicted transport protein
MIIFQNNKAYVETKSKKEKDFETEIIDNYRLFFGKNTIFIDAKKKIDSKALGGTIPDGFLIDLSDKNEPQFYIVEIELSSHDFYQHIFPQITKFFAFFINPKSRNDLIEKLFFIINNDDDLKKEMKKHLQEKEIYKFIKDIVDNYQNILLIIDDEKDELPEIFETYSDTWGKIVKLLILKKFINQNEIIYSMDPEFENLDYSYFLNTSNNLKNAADTYDETYHLQNIATELAELYGDIKKNLLLFDDEIKFNPRKYYIAIAKDRNIAFFQFSKKRIRFVVMMAEEAVRKMITKHSIKKLTESVQRFWNGPSCEIIIDNKSDVEEVIEVLKKLLMPE